MGYTEKWKVALDQRPVAVVPWGEHVIVAYNGLLEARKVTDGTIVAQGFHTFYESSFNAYFDLSYAYSDNGRGVLFYRTFYSVMTVRDGVIDFTEPQEMGYPEYIQAPDGNTWGELRLTDAAGRPGGGMRLLTGQRYSYSPAEQRFIQPGSGVQAWFYSLSGTTVTVDEVQSLLRPNDTNASGREFPPAHWMPKRRGLRHVGNGQYENGNGAPWGVGLATPAPSGGPDDYRVLTIHMATDKGTSTIQAIPPEVINT